MEDVLNVRVGRILKEVFQMWHFYDGEVNHISLSNLQNYYKTIFNLDFEGGNDDSDRGDEYLNIEDLDTSNDDTSKLNDMVVGEGNYWIIENETDKKDASGSNLKKKDSN